MAFRMIVKGRTKNFIVGVKYRDSVIVLGVISVNDPGTITCLQVELNRSSASAC